MTAQIIPVQLFDLVVFGATGDLAMRKLLPALYWRESDRQMPDGSRIVGCARRELTAEQYVAQIEAACRTHVAGAFEPEVFARLARRIDYVPLDAAGDGNWAGLAAALAGGEDRARLFYLATSPDLFGPISRGAGAAGLVTPKSRVVLEKPIGRDLASAIRINDEVGRVFSESQVYRIDHYLGKESVQNLLALRFANEMFEPIWNARYVDHVQITMAEDIGLGGRAGYYDGIGAARDVIQNHLLQLLALTAMEEPVSFEAHHLRAEKEKVLSSVRLPKDLGANTARGQYAAGWQGGEEVVGYLQEEGVKAGSTTETYAAMRLDVANARWAGVPFYLRTGKRLGKRVTEIAVVFKKAPHLPFSDTATEELGENAIVIRVQPDEGVTLRFGAKVPGATMEVRDVSMDFGYGRAFTETSPEAYERLILDVLLGDPPLFPRHEEVELSWEILDPVERYWARQKGRLDQYPAGTWGPKEADDMLAREGREWRMP